MHCSRLCAFFLLTFAASSVSIYYFCASSAALGALFSNLLSFLMPPFHPGSPPYAYVVTSSAGGQRAAGAERG